jgi:integrase
MLNIVLKKLDLPKAGLHAFRHGRVSLLQTMGVPGDLVKEWVGHSNLNTTSRYTHFQDNYRQQIASQVALFAQPGMGWDQNCRLVPMVPLFHRVRFLCESWVWL